ncbi:MAG: heme biosynthesis HemY N-terminal domain-containing protein [Azospirillaceae bacterium]
MWRILLLAIKIAVVVAIAVWLAERPGAVEIAWQGYVIETTVGMLILAAVVLVGLAALVYRFWRGLIGAPRAFGRARKGSRKDQGYRAISQGLVAVAAGDAETARRYARKADQLIDDPPLTMLLSAQAAQLGGDDTAARRYFEAMLKRPEMEFLGLRGLLTQAMREGDRPRALQLARRAKQLRPDAQWVLEAEFDLEVHQRRWSEALSTLTRLARQKGVDQPTARRHKAAIMIERSREEETEGKMTEALRHAHDAVNLLPDFVPAALREARLLVRAGKAKQAARLIEKTWARAPHRELAEVYRGLGPDGETALARVKRFEKLVKSTPQNPVAEAVMGEIAMEAELWGSARGHLTKAVAGAPNRRLYRLLADLEVKENDDTAAAARRLEQADAAPAEPTWTCGSCGAVSPLWGALCENCGAFDTMEWKSAGPAMAVLAETGGDGQAGERAGEAGSAGTAASGEPEILPPEPAGTARGQRAGAG